MYDVRLCAQDRKPTEGRTASPRACGISPAGAELPGPTSLHNY